MALIWMIAFGVILNGSNVKKLINRFADCENVAYFIDEVKEKAEQIKEVAKLINLQLE
jgi:hypothetical protein